MSTESILSDRDVNAPVNGGAPADAKDGASMGPAKSLEYHRQRLNDDRANQKYVSPSDGIMSPCTAKLSAYRNKHIMKAKPQSLFGKPAASNVSSGLSLASTPDKTDTKESSTESGTDDSTAASKESSPFR